MKCSLALTSGSNVLSVAPVARPSRAPKSMRRPSDATIASAYVPSSSRDSFSRGKELVGVVVENVEDILHAAVEAAKKSADQGRREERASKISNAIREIPVRSESLLQKPVPICPVEDETKTSVSIAGTQIGVLIQLVTFMVPVILIPLIEPAVSVVETGLLGNFATTVELASTASTALVFLFSVYAFNGLGVQALKEASKQLAHGEHGKAEETVSTAMAMGATWGVVSCAFLQLFGPALLCKLNPNPEILHHATAFLRIKSLALPAMSATFVFNHAHLAQRKQLRALFLQLAGMFTAVGLMTFFIAHLGLGLRGAAVAGVITQYAIFALQVGSARQLGRAGGLRVSFRKARWATMRGLFSRLGPLGLMYITKTAALCVITAAAAVTGLQHAAAHQAMWPIFICCSFLNYPMETAILAFIPAARTPKELRHTNEAIKWVSLSLAAISATIWFVVTRLMTFLLTKDEVLWPLIHEQSLVGAAVVAMIGLDVTAGGFLVAYGKGSTYAVIMTIALLVTMLGTHAAASMGLGLSGIWISVLLMVATRAAGTNIAAAFVNDPWGIAARISGDKRHPEARWAAKLALS